MRPFDEPDVTMCPFLRSVRQAHPGNSSDPFINACYLRRRPTRGNLIRALHTQASLCTSHDYVICPHYRVAACARQSRAKVPARA